MLPELKKIVSSYINVDCEEDRELIRYIELPGRDISVHIQNQRSNTDILHQPVLAIGALQETTIDPNDQWIIIVVICWYIAAHR